MEATGTKLEHIGLERSKVYVVIGLFANEGSYEDFSHFEETLAVFSDLFEAKKFAMHYDPVKDGILSGTAYDSYSLTSKEDDHPRGNHLFGVDIEICGHNLDDINYTDVYVFVKEFEVQ